MQGRMEICPGCKAGWIPVVARTLAWQLVTARNIRKRMTTVCFIVAFAGLQPLTVIIVQSLQHKGPLDFERPSRLVHAPVREEKAHFTICC